MYYKRNSKIVNFIFSPYVHEWQWGRIGCMLAASALRNDVWVWVYNVHPPYILH